jgi:serine/threonine protein kinase
MRNFCSSVRLVFDPTIIREQAYDFDCHSQRFKAAPSMQLQQLQMFYPRLHGSKNAAMSLRPHDEQLSPCPGKAAEERLRLFHKSWSNVDNVSGQNAAQDLHRYDAKNAFHFGRVIGKGGYSTVYRVFLRSSDQNDQCDHGGTNNKAGYADSDQAFALKRLQPRIIKNPKLLVTASSDLALEAAILSNLSHENIIKLHGVNDGDMIESLKDGRFFLVLDLLVETLEERLEKWSVHEKRPLFARRSHRFSGITRRLEDSAIGIAKGVEYLHSKNILYR